MDFKPIFRFIQFGWFTKFLARDSCPGWMPANPVILSKYQIQIFFLEICSFYIHAQCTYAYMHYWYFLSHNNVFSTEEFYICKWGKMGFPFGLAVLKSSIMDPFFWLDKTIFLCSIFTTKSWPHNKYITTPLDYKILCSEEKNENPQKKLWALIRSTALGLKEALLLPGTTRPNFSNSL